MYNLPIVIGNDLGYMWHKCVNLLNPIRLCKNRVKWTIIGRDGM